MAAGRMRIVGVVLVALAVAVAVAGCGGGDADKANAAIGEANAKIAEFNKLDGEISGVMSEIDNLGQTSADFKKGIVLIDKAQGMLDTRGKSTAAAGAAFAKISSMEVDEELKTYAAQQKAITELQTATDAKLGEMLVKLKALFEAAASGKVDEAMATKVTGEVETLSKELNDLSAQVEEKQTESDKFFQENGLGK